jgi:mannose-6-phosphate isomerase
LKYKKLPAGECYAIEAGLPHAYLRGTCLEIMKNSDNVVRLGLTPKLKDITTLLEIIQDQEGVDGIKV